jgi:hypothetical protein
MSASAAHARGTSAWAGFISRGSALRASSDPSAAAAFELDGRGDRLVGREPLVEVKGHINIAPPPAPVHSPPGEEPHDPHDARKVLEGDLPRLPRNPCCHDCNEQPRRGPGQRVAQRQSTANPTRATLELWLKRDWDAHPTSG